MTSAFETAARSAVFGLGRAGGHEGADAGGEQQESSHGDADSVLLAVGCQARWAIAVLTAVRRVTNYSAAAPNNAAKARANTSTADKTMHAWALLVSYR